MIQRRKYKGLVAFLILLLLSNSSLALENLTHSAHQHDDSHEMHGMSADVEIISASTSANSSDDCMCDDVCCLSSVGFALATDNKQILRDDSGSGTEIILYQSISLDLLLPPPTR